MSIRKSKRNKGSVLREAATAYAADDSAAPAFSREIGAGDFKARCLALMEEVRDRRGEYIITKRGAPIARLVPIDMVRRPLLGSMTGTVRTLGDLITPIDEPWDALEVPINDD